MHPGPAVYTPRWLRLESASPDDDVIALWIFALIGDTQWPLLQRYLDEWPVDHQPVAKA
jgi:hypothetical protein